MSDCDSTTTTTTQQKKETKEGEYGDDAYTYPVLDVPSNLNQFNQQHKSQIEKKYQTLVKNIYFYLAYVCLELNDYTGCVRNG